MNHRSIATAHASILALALSTGTALAHSPKDTGLPLDRYTWVTTHNAFTSDDLFRNQNQTIDEQLAGGVRGLMLDLYHHQDRVRLCHKWCANESRSFADLVNTTLLPFLENEPDAILTLHLEDHTSRSELVAELERTPGLVGKTFDPYAWTTSGWPTYADIVKSGQRVLIFDHALANSGVLLTRSGAIHVMHSEQFTVENYWSLGTTPLQHDRRCYSRWKDQELSRPEIEGRPGWRPLFTMNQFHGIPLPSHAWKDNALDELTVRYQSWCFPSAKRKPNYVAVDFYEEGNVGGFVDWLGALPDHRD